MTRKFFIKMDSDIILNSLWLVPFLAWFVTRGKSQIFRSAVTGVAFGLVVTHASFGLHALHLAWPVSEAFGQFGFYSSYIHVKAGVAVAIIVNLVPDHTPITDDQKLLIGIVNSISWAILYGVLGFLWSCLIDRWNKKS